MSAIEVDGLTKEFGPVAAVEDVSLAVAAGEAYALVGPNGSGKTTVIDAILGLLRPTGGTVAVDGYDVSEDPVAARERLGVVPEGTAVYDRLSGRRHVAFAAEARGVAVDADEVLERVGLREVADRPAGTYSAGMARRLVLATALVGGPSVLVFDEPFSGLDVDARAVLLRVLEEEREDGTAVLFATHRFDLVETTADRVGVLSEGLLAREFAVDDRETDRPVHERVEAAVAGGVSP